MGLEANRTLATLTMTSVNNVSLPPVHALVSQNLYSQSEGCVFYPIHTCQQLHDNGIQLHGVGYCNMSFILNVTDVRVTVCLAVQPVGNDGL